MARNRFEHIMANLHFTNNTDVRAANVRARKIRSVVETVQHTFPAGLKTPVISFDEDILLSKNRNNPTRQHMKANPITYCMRQVSTRVLSDLCCLGKVKHVLVTLYLDMLYLYTCRIEVYCGKAQQNNEVESVPESQQPMDPNTRPAAIIRNLAFQGEVYHVVVTDRFYTSVQRVYQLLSRIVYSIGTIMGDKVGYPQEIVGNKS
ncbi:LOW QUALITY PROTEIN: hypothetical protein PHMEG_00034651 [Phytophthora megakarya]|uniref:PiggyBac transposable element-derived protein domain-containing protein n=1 Tax=Phytophthora megakarya TaxID=4795 RepID=A0A225UQI7_9STRA|nr:LOW QUALITY PROTEIN: hypothetical protein PHMEG_00034651 [Phytophthora megakarya]